MSLCAARPVCGAGSQSGRHTSIDKIMTNLNANSRMLVAIASYGHSNDRFLARLVQEYRSMSFHVDIVVLSNIEKDVGKNVELVVGLPYKDPWTLPFPHKQIFADRLNSYDLFLYSEDDMLVTERNIRAFLDVGAALPTNLIPGFLQFEESPHGRNYPEFHGHFHWDTTSVRTVGPYTLAFFTNEHSGCYLLTQSQLIRAIDSGGYLVPPHQGKYDLLCTASTDPYTQCGFEKMICISAVDDFLVHHLPNKYVDTTFGIGDQEFRRQLDSLLSIAESQETQHPLFSTETRFRGQSYSKSYYEHPSQEIEEMLPAHARTVLSIGCGSGATEARLAAKGVKVTALPLDSVIAGCAAARGVEVIQGDFASARKQLNGRTFDCLLLLNVLHLVEDPVALLSSFRALLSEHGTVLSVLPNTARLVKPWARSTKNVEWSGNFRMWGLHFVSNRTINNWYQSAGIRIRKTLPILTPRAQRFSRLTLGFAASKLCSEFLIIGEIHG